jgi:23S rRNA (guanine2445-N2)-methyltransferase / 23S rRNA (guanine2069-N7)-methyltransferase
MQYELFVSCPKSVEYLLEAELLVLGMKVERTSPQGVFGHASLSVVYQICLWSRLANRVQLILFSGLASNETFIQKLCNQFPWQTVFLLHKSFAISFHGTNAHIRNTMYGAQLIKDAIVDHFRSQLGMRPNVDKDNPEVRLHAHLKDDQLTVSLDLSGTSLHQRAYRLDAGIAPLKENLAAALLIRAGWPQLGELGHHLHDVCCGAGTLVIEAAMMAAQIAPGLLRESYGFDHWVGHDESLWNKIKQDALKTVKPIASKLLGSDVDERTIKHARQNAERAGVASLVQFETIELSKTTNQLGEKGLLICNPPYGERLGEVAPLIGLYQQLGAVMHQQFAGWKAAVFTGNPLLAKAIGLRAHKKYAFYNGAIPCELYLFNLDESNRLKSSQHALAVESNDAIAMVVNRLTKNKTHLAKWAKRNHIHAYRLYDADMPEYAFAIDCYDDYLVFQEYMAPKSISPNVAERRRIEMIQALMQVMQVEPDKLVLKQRSQQKGESQYERLNRTNAKLEIQEGRAKFLVNIHDYLDTGLFLDHRPLRLQFARLKPGIRFLNLFCYTATASVHAALAGAMTTNVDLSNTYLRWAQENFKINGLNVNEHQFIGFDVKRWLSIARHEYDVIFLDPPTFSNSKKMEDTLDVQRDHVTLIEDAMRLLAKDGVLYFSTNLRRFKLDPLLAERFDIKDITPATIDEDFKRDAKIHTCFKMMRR